MVSIEESSANPQMDVIALEHFFVLRSAPHPVRKSGAKIRKQNARALVRGVAMLNATGVSIAEAYAKHRCWVVCKTHSCI